MHRLQHPSILLLDLGSSTATCSHPMLLEPSPPVQSSGEKHLIKILQYHWEGKDCPGMPSHSWEEGGKERGSFPASLTEGYLLAGALHKSPAPSRLLHLPPGKTLTPDEMQSHGSSSPSQLTFGALPEPHPQLVACGDPRGQVGWAQGAAALCMGVNPPCPVPALATGGNVVGQHPGQVAGMDDSVGQWQCEWVPCNGLPPCCPQARPILVPGAGRAAFLNNQI